MLPVDNELLSAYLNGDLTDAERIAFEARLERELDLRAALDDLRFTVALLHAAPQLVPPRNFTLDPARYGRSRSARLLQMPVMLRAAAGIAALVIVVSLAVFAFRSAPNASNQGAAVGFAATPAPSAKDESTLIARQAPVSATVISLQRTATPTVLALFAAVPSATPGVANELAAPTAKAANAQDAITKPTLGMPVVQPAVPNTTSSLDKVPPSAAQAPTGSPANGPAQSAAAAPPASPAVLPTASPLPTMTAVLLRAATGAPAPTLAAVAQGGIAPVPTQTSQEGNQVPPGSKSKTGLLDAFLQLVIRWLLDWFAIR